MPENLLEIIKNRRSIRRYQNKEIPKEIIDKLIEALIWAPSAGNLQSRKFHFVFDQKIKEELMNATSFRQKFVSQAPLAIVCSTDAKLVRAYGNRGVNVFSICDVSASIQNLLLTAYSQGLGTCWVGAFDEKKVKEILKMTANLKPIAIVPVGYPAESPNPHKRVSPEKAITFV